MKHILLFFVVFYLSVISYGQIVNYAYDNSGNRTSRTVTLSKSILTDRDSSKSQEKITEQIEDQSIIVYPNPVREEINVEISGYDESRESSITVIDQGGRILINQVQVSNRNTLNLSRYPTGVYFMIIRLGNNKTKYTIIKE